MSSSQQPTFVKMMKNITQKRQDAVRGYIRPLVSLLIPLPIINICIIYYGNPDDFEQLVQDCYKETAAIQFGCTRQLRFMLSQANNPPIAKVIDSGVVPRLMQFCRNNKHPELQYESLWALLNIASGPAESTAHVIRNGSHNVFIELLQHPLYEIMEQALWACGNIAGDGAELKDLLINNNILPNILKICQTQFDTKHVTNFTNVSKITDDPMLVFIQLLSTCSWTLSNLCRGSPVPNIEGLEYLVNCFRLLLQQALDMNDKYNNNNSNRSLDLGKKDEIITNIAWGFSYLTGFDRYNTQLVNKLDELGILKQFVELMDHNCGQVRHPIRRFIGNILTGSDEHTKMCLDLGILSKYSLILKHLNPSQREQREIFWSLSNICATDNSSDKILVLKEGLFIILIDSLQNTNIKYDASKEALWAISNATTKCDKYIINHLVENGIQNALHSFWRKHESNLKKRILLVALECVQNILSVDEGNKYSVLFEECGIVAFLKELEADEENVDDEVYEICVNIINKYFSLRCETIKCDTWDCICGLRNNISRDSCQACFKCNPNESNRIGIRLCS